MNVSSVRHVRNKVKAHCLSGRVSNGLSRKYVLLKAALRVVTFGELKDRQPAPFMNGWSLINGHNFYRVGPALCTARSRYALAQPIVPSCALIARQTNF